MSPVSKAIVALGALSLAISPSLAVAQDGEEEAAAVLLDGFEIGGIVLVVLGVGLLAGGNSQSN